MTNYITTNNYVFVYGTTNTYVYLPKPAPTVTQVRTWGGITQSAASKIVTNLIKGGFCR